LLIAGTRSIAHLEENVGAGNVALSAEALARLDAVCPPGESPQHGHGFEATLESFRRTATT
jgi:aryl-alcohol dehydrogenase-like predicted oxidoreductase